MAHQKLIKFLHPFAFAFSPDKTWTHAIEIADQCATTRSPLQLFLHWFSWIACLAEL